MIYTITFNPAVDMVYQLDQLVEGGLNRSAEESYVAGGKGVNASILLRRLGHENRATGFLGGFTGQFIKDELQAEGIDPYFIEVDGFTRINAKINTRQATATEVNGEGPQIPPAKREELAAFFTRELQAGDVVFLMGNKAPGMTADDFKQIADICLDKGARFVLDTNRDLLRACLASKPFIIKPNNEELSEIFKVKIESVEAIIHYAKKLQEEGAENVLVSLGAKGALLVAANGEVYQSDVPDGQVVNPTGAGDSMLAGFMAKYLETEDYAKSLKQGAASGSATTYSAGIATADKVYALYEEINVNQIK